MRSWAIFAAATGVILAAVPASAQSVKASDPMGMLRTLQQAGHQASLTTDTQGDPKIDIKFGGWNGSILFYDCDDQTNDKCRSIQLVAAFDRKEPMPFSMMNDLVRSQRFISMYLDDEGDPYVQWDINIDDGISRDLFLASVSDFAGRVDYVSTVVFAEENGK